MLIEPDIQLSCHDHLYHYRCVKKHADVTKLKVQNVVLIALTPSSLGGFVADCYLYVKVAKSQFPFTTTGPSFRTRTTDFLLLANGTQLDYRGQEVNPNISVQYSNSVYATARFTDGKNFIPDVEGKSSVLILLNAGRDAATLLDKYFQTIKASAPVARVTEIKWKKLVNTLKMDSTVIDIMACGRCHADPDVDIIFSALHPSASTVGFRQYPTTYKECGTDELDYGMSRCPNGLVQPFQPHTFVAAKKTPGSENACESTREIR